MTTERTYFQTTPIYYVNDVPHAGHAYATIATDALARSRRLQGHRVFFLTGTDEHGQNIERIARERGIPERQLCDENSARFRELWGKLDVAYDGFIRTTDELHKRGVRALWARLVAAEGPDGRPVVYRGKYAGWYCPRCEAFKDDDELKQPGNLCPLHELSCEWTEEENFFFRLSAYQQWLQETIGSGALRIDPEGRRNEVLAVLRQGLQDFSISRARVKWGIPVPEEPSHVFYVWMDALANYITALGFADRSPEYQTFWERADERFHLIGKEIIRFHCLYWPAMLKAADLPVPTREFAHGWMTRNGRKLSKTTGNVVDPFELVDRLGPDAVRYYFLREGSFGQDWDFTDAGFVGRYNADLANDLGNLVSRALTMVARYCGDQVPPRPGPPPQGALGFETGFQVDAVRSQHVDQALAAYEELDFGGALTEVWSWISQLNQRIVVLAPWELAKDAGRRSELDAFLYRLLEAIRFTAVLVSPVMPRAAGRILHSLGLAPKDPGPQDLAWGRLEPGARLGPIEPLFPRVEKDGARPAPKETAVSQEKPTPPPVETTQAAPPPVPDRIDISEFAKVELRAARVTAAEKVAGSKKLVRLEVDLGGETRQVVAGIAESYAAEALVGKTVVIVANLKPAKLMGLESNGMVLAGSLDGKAVLCTFDGEVAPGTKVK